MRADRNLKLRKRLRELAEEKRRWGCPLLYQWLKREGFAVNHKRVERLYREEGLSLRRKRRRNHLSYVRVTLPPAERANQVWALDFVHDSLLSGRRFRALTIIDQWSRECPAIAVDTSLTGARVTQVLEQLKKTRGLPGTIQSDNGSEFTSRVMDQWAYERGVKLQFIEPGKPIQNAFIESFNSRFREECLNEQVFVSLDDARRKIERWRVAYNRERPHSSLGYLTPPPCSSVPCSERIGTSAYGLSPRASRLATQGSCRAIWEGQRVLPLWRVNLRLPQPYKVPGQDRWSHQSYGSINRILPHNSS